jgi:hypothetical protein
VLRLGLSPFRYRVDLAEAEAEKTVSCGPKKLIRLIFSVIDSLFFDRETADNKSIGPTAIGSSRPIAVYKFPAFSGKGFLCA